MDITWILIKKRNTGSMWNGQTRHLYSRKDFNNPNFSAVIDRHPATGDGETRVQLYQSYQSNNSASVSIVSQQQLRKRLPKKKVRPSTIVRRTYTAEKIPLLGESQLCAGYKGQKHTLTGYITRGVGHLCWDGIGLRKFNLTEGNYLGSCAII